MSMPVKVYVHYSLERYAFEARRTSVEPSISDTRRVQFLESIPFSPNMKSVRNLMQLDTTYRVADVN
jgi:hypothetical protein